MAAEKNGNEISIQIQDGTKTGEVRSTIKAPDGMRIAGWDAINVQKVTPAGSPALTGSVTLSLRVRQGTQTESQTVATDAELAVGLKGSAHAVSVDAAVGGHVKANLNKVFTNAYEKYTVELVADVAPKKSFGRVTEKVNLDAKLKVYFEPMPQLANENTASTTEQKLPRLQNTAKVNLEGTAKLDVVDSGLVNISDVPLEAADRMAKHQLEMLSGGGVNSPTITAKDQSELKRLNVGLGNFSFAPAGPSNSQTQASAPITTSSASLCTKQGLFAVAAVGTVVAGVALAKACAGEEEQLECVQDTLKNMCTVL